MSEENRTEWPSSSFLEDLRTQGVVPSHVFSRRSIGALSCLLYATIMYLSSGALSAEWKEALSKSWSSESMEPYLLLAKRTLMLWVLCPAAVVSLSVLLIGLFQSKFMCRAANLGWSWERLSLSRVIGFGAICQRFILMVCILAVLFVVGLGLTIGYSGRVTGALLMKPGEISSYVSGMIPFGAFYLVGLLSAGCLVGWLTESVWFRSKHRMTKKEADAEASDR